MNNLHKFCEYVSELCIKSILYEVSATPKPGLVDRNNCGAHKDMDFFTFLNSSSALTQIFYKCALEGYKLIGDSFEGLLSKIRPIGIDGESKMLRATGGVNTHKGIIFSLGIIAAAAGSIYRDTQEQVISSESICDRVIEMTKGISKRELEVTGLKRKLTYGEMLYKKYGIKGIRGEVESGFMTVRKASLPIIKELMKDKNHHLNDVLVQTLLHLISHTEDSNVLGRHDINTLEFVKSEATKALKMGGIFTEEGRVFLESMDKSFIQKNISPGGSADLLAVTLILYFLEGKE